ncbi:MAG: LTA synthase family protein, partial [Muribaculaceae bacterium]|nr:LTA synthase family protein [Muribaculaceae bacterium]
VVSIILESFGKEYIGALNHDILGGGYKGYAPFIDSLVNVSATWQNTFDNGQKSIEAMPSVLAGIPSFVKSFVLTSASMNRLKGLPAILGEEGYATAFFHGARKGSMGFDGFARSVGFKEYYGRESFIEDGRAGGEEEFDGYWGIWDEPFLQFFALKLSDMPEPFMASLFTLSSHHPFNVPDKYKGRFPKGTAPIHQTIGYTDNALREFFATASRQPWYKNTIFVITNDHTNERCHDEYRSAISAFYGPILIFDPAGQLPRGVQEGIAQQTDIMPTILGLTGSRQGYVAFGKDLFTTPAEEDWAVNYNGLYQYVKYGYVLQFDGKKNVGLFQLGDHKMKRNLLGTNPELERKMQRELEALIQQYMQRMLNDGLTVDKG